jgi:hexosaminidase
LVPLPTQVELEAGNWTLNRTTRLVARGVAAKEATKLAEALSVPLGWRMPVVRGQARKGDIEMTLTAPDPRLGAEGYRLSITPDRVTIRAATAAGLFYGGVTLRQLLPPAVFASNRVADVSAAAWCVRAVEIVDSPRFAWRGLLVDPARHFLPPEFLKKLVDVMALHKLNTLQIHLTDDAGWRFEIKKYPRLTQIGSRRAESPRHGDANLGDGTPYGPFFYSQAQMRELVAYAAARHITILPEIEMPGHFQAALAAYPQFSCTGGPFEVRTRWGVQSDILCPGNDAAVAFAQDVLAEVVAVFPSRFIHIGGDEAPRDRWKTCPKCQARIKAEGLKGEPQLQTWLNSRIERFLVSKGRRMIGWDEILEGGLTPGAAVMSWRGMEGGIAAAEAGHDVVMSPTTHCYFDYAQAKGPSEPESIGGFIPLATVYGFEPMPPQLAAEKQRHVLGAQGNVWGEFIWTPLDVEYFAFPRAAALAEVVWSPAHGRDYADFLRRLARHLQRLDQLHVNYRKLDPPTP